MNWMVVAYVGCEILVAIGAIFGNSLVITAFRRERRLRRRTNYYIVSLAVADLLVGLLGIPCALLAYSGYPKQLHACLFTVSLLVVLCTISIFSLVAVSVDRYWAILYPMGYSRNVRTKTAVGIICFCWVAGAIVGFLPLLGWNAGQSGQELEECRFTKVMNYNFLVFIYFATIIFPGLLMAAFYAHIYSVVVKQLKQMVTVNGTSGGSGAMLRVLGAARKREVKATQNLSIIVLFFMMCWFPLYTINFIQAYHKDISIPTFLMDSCIILTHLNSAGNPLLYAYHLRDFRTALRAVLFGDTPNVNNRVIGRDNSAYLHDLEQRRRSSQLNLYHGKSMKDQNLNLTNLPVIHNKLSDIQETSRIDSVIKVIPSENNCEISKTTSFFKFPLDRSLTRLKDKEKIYNFTTSNNDKQDFTYNHLEESNVSVANDGNATKDGVNEGVIVNGGVINNGFLKKDEPEMGDLNNYNKEALHREYDTNMEVSNSLKIADKNVCDNPDESKSCTKTGEKKKKESCDDADYGEDDTDDDDTNVKTGNEITTGIFNDCFVAHDDDDSIDEIDNSILSHDRVGSLVKNEGQVVVGYRNLGDNDSEQIQVVEEMYSDLERNDSEICILYNKLSSNDLEEVGNTYNELNSSKEVDKVDIPYNKLSSNDLEEVGNTLDDLNNSKEVDEVGIPCNKLSSNDLEEVGNTSDDLNNSKKVDQVGIPYNKLSSNDLEEVGNTYDGLNTIKLCDKVSEMYNSFKKGEIGQIVGDLNRNDTEESSQKGTEKISFNEYGLGRFETVDVPYSSLVQEDMEDISYSSLNKERDIDREEEDCLEKLEGNSIEKSKNNSTVNKTDLGENKEPSCIIVTQSLDLDCKKDCKTQENITSQDSSAIAINDETKCCDKHNQVGSGSRTVVSDTAAEVSNIKLNFENNQT